MAKRGTDLWRDFLEDTINSYTAFELMAMSPNDLLETYTQWLERGELIKWEED